MTTWKADLHNHSCLSPCGSLEMSPTVLVQGAVSAGIDILALTDHNSAMNLPTFGILCERHGITPVFGMEVTTMEEVHVVCLFEGLQDAMDFGTYIDALLPDMQNRPEIFGDQVYVDEEEQILGEVEKILSGSALVSFDDLIQEVLYRQGLVIPAHIDRPVHGAVAQLGFLPDLPYSAVESIIIPCPYETYGNTVITGSDAHYPNSIGRRSFRIRATGPRFKDLRSALAAGDVMTGAKGV